MCPTGIGLTPYEETSSVVPTRGPLVKRHTVVVDSVAAGVALGTGGCVVATLGHLFAFLISVHSVSADGALAASAFFRLASAVSPSISSRSTIACRSGRHENL